MERNKSQLTIQEKASRFIFEWHKFPLDYWWRKKYDIPFGSPQHRVMNFIDMLIDYQEGVIINRQIRKLNEKQDDSYEDEEVLDSNRKTVALTQKEIDDDFDNFDLENFDKK